MKHVLPVVLLFAPLSACQNTPDEVAVQEASAPTQEEAMAMMMELAAPNEHHERLNAMAGTFDAAMTIWMEPGGAPIQSTGTTTNEWVLGGRFLYGTFDGEFQGMPFEGISYTGYDRLREAYVGTWIDNMGTQMMEVSIGTLSDDGSTITFERTVMDLMTEGENQMTEITKIVDENRHEFTMWTSAPGIDPFKTLEIVYTRKR